MEVTGDLKKQNSLVCFICDLEDDIRGRVDRGVGVSLLVMGKSQGPVLFSRQLQHYGLVISYDD